MGRAKPIKVSATLEDYVETIWLLQQANRVARVKDIATELDITRGSVSASLKTLAEKKLIDYAPYSFITLTPTGESLAKEIVRRHKALSRFFVELLGMSQEAGEENACRVEHAVDKEAVDRLVSFMDFVSACPRSGRDWLDRFADFCKTGLDPERCLDCVTEIEGACAEPRTSL